MKILNRIQTTITLLLHNLNARSLLIILALVLHSSMNFAQNSYCMEVKWVADHSFYSNYNNTSGQVNKVINKINEIFENANICLTLVNQGPFKIHTIQSQDPYPHANLPPHPIYGDVTITKVMHEFEQQTDNVAADAILLFSSQALSNHGFANSLETSLCNNESRVIGLSHHKTGRHELSITIQAAIMAHELIHIIRDDAAHDCNGSTVCDVNCLDYSLMSCAGPNHAKTNISSTDKIAIEASLSNNSNSCFSNNCPSCSTPVVPCTDNLEPNNSYTNANTINPSTLNKVEDDLCLDQSDVDIFKFIYNNIEYIITCNLKPNNPGEFKYNFEYFKNGSNLTIETTFHSGAAPPDTELFILTKVGEIYYSVAHDDNSGSNPPMSKINLDLNNISIPTDGGVPLTCGSNCSDNIRMNCSIMEVNIEQSVGGTNASIAVNQVQITNEENFPINDLRLQVSLLGNGEEHFLYKSSGETVILIDLPKDATITANIPLLYIPWEADGAYTLRVELIDYGMYCESANQVYIGDFSYPIHESCYDRQQNQNETGIDCGGVCEACDTCPENLNLQTISTAKTYKANNRVSGNGSIALNSGIVNFNGGRKVDLLPGFLADASNGYSFRAEIKDCVSNQKVSHILTDEIMIEQSKENITTKTISTEAISIIPEFDVALKRLYGFDTRNYPNPFNTETIIELKLERAGTVSILINNLNGKLVSKVRDNTFMPEGLHQFTFDGSKHNPGIYYYTVLVDDKSQTKKMILIR